MQQAKVTEIVSALSSLAETAKFPMLNEIAGKFKQLNEEAKANFALYEIGNLGAVEKDMLTLLEKVVDRIILETHAERGMIILVNESNESEIEIARNSEKRPIERPLEEISAHAVQRVLNQRCSICVPDIEKDPQLRKRESVARLSLLAVVGVPILLETKLLGLIYLDNRSYRHIFNMKTVHFVEKVAEQIALAVEKLRIQRALECRNASLENMLRENYKFEPFIGHHPAIIRIMDLVAKVAATDATVLIEGDTGTGKELVARALHFNSNRANNEMVAINCGALPENLLESELFGHKKGAFTGAIADKKGKFESANNGTIFLDEISEMEPRLQVKLLRILQSGEYNPVGSERLQRCNVRVIAATNQDLRQLVAEGRFRNDLYYRLNIVRLSVPRLVERKSDIMILANFFLEQYRKKLNRPNLHFSRSTERYLNNYEFPGNVRELENIVERAAILAHGDEILPTDLSEEIQTNYGIEGLSLDFRSLSFRDAKTRIVNEFERAYLVHALTESKGVIRQAARYADMDVKNFHEKITRLAINIKDFK